MSSRGEPMGKMGDLFYGESGKQIGKFPIFSRILFIFIEFS